MVKTEAGIFRMGADDGLAADEFPKHDVDLKAYWMDKLEVTTGDYDTCLMDGACSATGTHGDCNSGRGGRQDHPINCVTWDQAVAYCTSQGKRLPMEAEWEKGARGTDGRQFPWKEGGPTTTKLNYFWNEFETTTPVGSYPDGASPFGLLDMSGNVAEWTADFFDANFYATSKAAFDPEPVKDPFGPLSSESTNRVFRGGDYGQGRNRAETVSTTVRSNQPAGANN